MNFNNKYDFIIKYNLAMYKIIILCNLKNYINK